MNYVIEDIVRDSVDTNPIVTESERQINGVRETANVPVRELQLERSKIAKQGDNVVKNSQSAKVV